MPNQKKFTIKIFCGENYFVKDNTSLGELEINDLPQGPAVSVSLKIRFEVNEDGLLKVIAEANGIKLKENYSLFEKKNIDSPIIISLKANPE